MTCFSPTSVLYQIGWLHVCYLFCGMCSTRVATPLTFSLLALSTVNVATMAGSIYLYSCQAPEAQAGHLENIPTFVGKIVLGFVVAEVWQYVTHRFLHLPWFYNHIHSWHHKYRHPTSVTTFYAHPLENLVFNVGTVLVPMYVLQMSHLCSHLFIAVSVLSAVASHSGWMYLGSLMGWYYSAHDEHHEYMICEYGPGLFMDYLFKTRHKDMIKPITRL